MDFKFAIGILSTRRSWYRARQPQVFLQHDSHRACQDVLGLQSYPGYHRFFSRATGIFGVSRRLTHLRSYAEACSHGLQNASETSGSET